MVALLSQYIPFYQLNQSGSVPFCSGKEFSRIVEAALPLISLYKPMERPLAYLMGGLNILDAGRSLDESLLPVVKNIFEFAGIVLNHKASLKIGKIVSVTEGFLGLLRETGVPLFEKIMALVIDALALVNLCLFPHMRRSLQVTIISYVAQTVLNLYQVNEAKKRAQQKEWKSLEGAEFGLKVALTAVRGYQAWNYYQIFTQAAHRVIVLMRHADKDKGNDPALTERGRNQTGPTAQAIKELHEEYGCKKVAFFVSSMKRSQETGRLIAENESVKSLQSQFTEDARLREKEHDPTPRKVRKVDPSYKAYEALPPEKRFFTKPNNTPESRYQLFQRMFAGIMSAHAQTPPGDLVVVVSHGQAIRDFFQGLNLLGISQDPRYNDSSERWARHHPNTCEIYVMNGFGESLENRFRAQGAI